MVDSVEARNYFPCTIAASNVGKVEGLKSEYDDFKIDFLQFFTNQVAGFVKFLFNIVTVEDTCYCNYTYVRPLQSRQNVLTLVREVLHEIANIIPEFQLRPNVTDPDLFVRKSALKDSHCSPSPLSNFTTIFNSQQPNLMPEGEGVSNSNKIIGKMVNRP